MIIDAYNEYIFILLADWGVGVFGLKAADLIHSQNRTGEFCGDVQGNV